MGILRPSWAEISLGALKSNYLEVKRRVPQNVDIMAMVKADAYGHGAVPIAKTLVENGVASLCVATVEEGLELRESGIDKTPILVMGGLMGMGTKASRVMVKSSLTPVIHSAEVLKSLSDDAKSLNKKIGIHLKIDTGMTRLGIMPASLPHLLREVNKYDNIKLEGVMTHLATARDPQVTDRQLAIFGECVEVINHHTEPINVWHVGNSSAIIDGVDVGITSTNRAWVRPGIILYGVPPHPDYYDRIELRPVMSLKSRVVLIKKVPEGTPISYGGTYVTKRKSLIGVLPIGYADGYSWSLSNKADVLVRGKRVPIVGSVTMDMVMVDLTDLKEVHIGDEVVLLGAQGDEFISADELAKKINTISYEVFCGVSKRVPRVYVD